MLKADAPTVDPADVACALDLTPETRAMVIEELLGDLADLVTHPQLGCARRLLAGAIGAELLLSAVSGEQDADVAGR